MIPNKNTYDAGRLRCTCESTPPTGRQWQLPMQLYDHCSSKSVRPFVSQCFSPSSGWSSLALQPHGEILDLRWCQETLQQAQTGGSKADTQFCRPSAGLPSQTGPYVAGKPHQPHGQQCRLSSLSKRAGVVHPVPVRDKGDG